MIELDMIVPTMETTWIKDRQSEEFQIISTQISKPFGNRYFHLRTTEEEAIALILKYGNNQVWIR